MFFIVLATEEIMVCGSIKKHRMKYRIQLSVSIFVALDIA